jgi:hypothetical protein
VAATVALFAVILAFLAGRVHAGADPGMHTPATQSRPAATPTPVLPDDRSGAPDGGVAPDSDPPNTHAS